MNFIFTVKTHGFVNAGVLEETLKKMSVQYDVEIQQNVSRRPGKKRVTMDASQVHSVAKLCKQYPTETDAQIGARAGISRATVARIRNGKHTLQQAAQENKS